ncbi:MAG: threonine--tRNA ligase [Candidatus Nealsonbacteria bacterium]|nr:threonine--tRNA ligase [Candidatus Nealsonbacteria bacterium]
MKRNKKACNADHRKLGELLDLFSFHDIAPAMVFWHPKGMIIINELRNYIRELQKERGYLETATPLLVKKELYKISGHWEHYQENIWSLKIENQAFALKPMSCPETVYIYASKIRSYKDLPLRFSEFGYVHRREKSGVLTGLFRVYGFIQDDAHIFCRPDQIFTEINNVLKLLTKIHKTFNLKTSFALATKPSKAMGDLKLWKKAENSLEFALKKRKLRYETRPKDGAFYGPKIDVDVEDSLGRKWTLATIQLDFQIPSKFNLFYIDQKGKKQEPVIIHRSSIGSFERFIGILLEHYNGSLPFWLSPVQIWIIPIGKQHTKYAQDAMKKFIKNNYRCELKDTNETMSKKIREGEIQKIPYLLVLGDKEINTQTVRIRQRGKGDIGAINIEKFIAKIKTDADNKRF